LSAHLKMGLRLAQRLKMTPQLQQSIRLLTLPLTELEQAVREEILENPVLEEVQETMEEQSQEELSNKEEIPDRPTWMEYTDSGSVRIPRSGKTKFGTGIFDMDHVVSTEKSLYEHLIWQIQMSGFSNKEKVHLNLLVDHLDDDGYLKTSLEEITDEIDVELSDLQRALKILHSMDPCGVGAKDLKDCLMIQAHQHQNGNTHLIAVIENHLANLERKDFNTIARDLNLQEEEVMDLYKIITAMEPKPGRLFVSQPVQYVVPDVYVSQEGNEYRVSLNEEGLPHLRVAHLYQDMLRQLNSNKVSSLDSTHRYLRHKMNSALWLIRSLNQRQRTIFRVTSAIVRYQKDFFDKGPLGMKPLVLRQIAEELGLHESTISRVTTNKYVHTPHGLYELKYFFGAGVETETGEKLSGEVVKLKIKYYIAKEDKSDPLSDQDLVDMLQSKMQLYLSRRTVAKYRETMNILPASRRRKA